MYCNIPSGASSNRSNSARVGLTPSDKMADIVKFLYRNPFREYRFPSKSKKSPSEWTSPPIALKHQSMLEQQIYLILVIVIYLTASGSNGFATGLRFFLRFPSSLS